MDELKEVLKLARQPRTGTKAVLVDRVLHAEGFYQDESKQFIEQILEKSSDSKTCPNDFYKSHFNAVDAFNGHLENKSPHDKMNDWRSRMFWDMIQIVLKNTFHVIRQSRSIEWIDFLKEIGCSLLETCGVPHANRYQI